MGTKQLSTSPTSDLAGKKQTSVLPSRQPSGNLQFSELRYRRLFETAQDGILLLDGDTGKISDANPFIKEVLGYSQAELLGKELWQIGIFSDIVVAKAAFVQLQMKGYIRYKDLPLQTKDGRSIDVEFVSNVYMVDEQKVIQCNIRDITERTTAEKLAKSRAEELEKLSRAQEKTKKAMLNIMEDLEAARALIELEKVKDEAMLASIGEGLIAVDNNRKIMVINKAAERMLGQKAQDLIGKELTRLPLHDQFGNVVSTERRPTTIALTTGKMVNSTFFFARKDKTRVPIAITVTPIKLSGRIIGAVDIFRDITREKEIDRAKSEFVSLASHQLRTPLGIIKWYLEALENEEYIKNGPPIIHTYFNEIHKSNERVLSLVRDLLSVSRIEQGKVKNMAKPSDLIAVVREIVKQMDVMAQKKQVSLHLSVPDTEVPLITIDVLRFHEVVENLIVNAIEYVRTGDSVKVTVKRVDDNLLIGVKDTGIGISEADQQKIFTKFFRAEKAIRHNPEGSGLGLYVVKSYVEGWGGEISAASTEDKGSTFTISLPISQNKSPRRKT